MALSRVCSPRSVSRMMLGGVTLRPRSRRAGPSRTRTTRAPSSPAPGAPPQRPRAAHPRRGRDGQRGARLGSRRRAALNEDRHDGATHERLRVGQAVSRRASAMPVSTAVVTRPTDDILILCADGLMGLPVAREDCALRAKHRSHGVKSRAVRTGGRVVPVSRVERAARGARRAASSFWSAFRRMKSTSMSSRRSRSSRVRSGWGRVIVVEQ
jgi:hypothetical protein